MAKKLVIVVSLLLSQIIAFGQVKVTFIIDKVAPFKTTTPNLYLAGDFNSWNAADTAWKMNLDLAGRYQLV